jgi:predicted regulator of Ras-like GTPase activity (Roadblock/LC7/MglB family)
VCCVLRVVGQVRSTPVDAEAALAELFELSTQVVEAVVVGPDGVQASGTADANRAEQLAGVGSALLDAAAQVRPGPSAVERVVVELPSAAVVVVRAGDVAVVATTAPEPTMGLVTYDLRVVLRRLEQSAQERSAREKPARRSRKKSS